MPKGVSVTYDAASDVEIGFVRVDGTLAFATQKDTRLLVDTIVTTPGSRLSVGSADDPVRADVTATIVFADAGPIDLARDPLQLSRGLVSHGEITVHGAAKASSVALEGAAMAGATELVLKEAPAGWRVGDTIVVMGTERGTKNADGTLRTQDEERTITAINGNKVTLDAALKHDHAAPEGFGFEVMVGNASRNVVFTSENPDGVRGHVMVMHTPDADIRYGEFLELGRTDKSRLLDDATNPPGRYPIHLHRAGTEGDDWAVVVGNAVVGGPGWGIVQHDSNAAIDHNFVFDITGAGIVSEAGNERGQWIGNFVTSITGSGDPISTQRDEKFGDFGHAGVAYESQARQIIQQDNVASGSVVGWAYRHPPDDFPTMVYPERGEMQFDPFPLDADLTHEEPQIMAFLRNTAAAVDVGFDSGHRVQTEFNPELISQMIEFDVWRSGNAVDLINYTGDYVFKDSDWVDINRGIVLPQKHQNTTLVNVHIEDANVGIRNYGLNYDGAFVDVTFRNVGTPIIEERANLFGETPRLRSQDLDILPRPVVKIDPSSDLTIGPRDQGVEIKGTVTDSLGTRDFGGSRWIGPDRDYYAFQAVADSVTETLNGTTGMSIDTAFDLYGAFQKPDGTWVMPVIHWVSDRYTAEAHPTVIELKLVGFDAATLEAHRIDSVTVPSGEITVVDTLAGSTGATEPPPATDPDPLPEPDPAPDPAPEPEPDGSTAPEEPAPSGRVVDGFDRIVFHFDGNNNDPDDIAALPVAAILASAAGLEDKITFFFGNNLVELNKDGQLAKMEASAAFAESIGVPTVGYQDGEAAATAELARIFNSGDKVLVLEGGPMEATYRALALTDEGKRGNVTQVSHSTWNEDRARLTDTGETLARTWDDIARDFAAVEQIEILDQNAGGNNDTGFNNLNWSWMDASDDPVIEAARTAMNAAGDTKKNDASDAGMLFWALTGNEKGTPQDAEAFIEAGEPLGFVADGPSEPAPGEDPDPAPGGEPGPAPGEDTEPPAGEGPDGLVAAYNFGAGTVTGSDGIVYEAFDIPGTSTYSVASSVDIAGTADDALYRSEAWGQDQLTISLAVPESGVYRVDLLAAEIWEGAATAGKRVFDVMIEGTRVFDDVDLAADPGYLAATTLSREVSVTDGTLDILLDGEVQNPKLSALRVVKLADGAEPPAEPPADEAGLTVALIDTATDTIVTTLEAGDTIDFALVGNRSVTLAVIDAPDDVESVRLGFGDRTKVENIAPYALYGDRDGDYLGGTKLARGEYTLSVEAFDTDGARGEVVADFDLGFSVL